MRDFNALRQFKRHTFTRDADTVRLIMWVSDRTSLKALECAGLDTLRAHQHEATNTLGLSSYRAKHLRAVSHRLVCRWLQVFFDNELESGMKSRLLWQKVKIISRCMLDAQQQINRTRRPAGREPDREVAISRGRRRRVRRNSRSELGDNWVTERRLNRRSEQASAERGAYRLTVYVMYGSR